MAVQRNPSVVSQEELLLRKRARRRLVGAVGLVLLAVIVLPLVLDREPKGKPHNVRVEMPSPAPHPAQTSSSSEVSVPNPPAEAAQPASASAQASAPEPVRAVPPPLVPATPAAPAKREPPSASLSVPRPDPKSYAVASRPVPASEFVIQLGAFSEIEKAQALEQRLKKGGFPAYLERAAQGNRTRVRAGPYASREAAQKAYSLMKQRNLTDRRTEGQIVPKGL
jgi:DedD protein